MASLGGVFAWKGCSESAFVQCTNVCEMAFCLSSLIAELCIVVLQEHPHLLEAAQKYMVHGLWAYGVVQAACPMPSATQCIAGECIFGSQCLCMCL